MARRAFTLIEVLLVVVLMAALGAVMISRLSGTTDRQFDLAASQVGDLLLMYAIRSEFSSEPVGISANPERNSLRLLVRRGGLDAFSDGWEADPSVREVRLPDFIDVRSLEFQADGDSIDPTDQPITGIPGQPRPQVEVRMRSSDDISSREVHLILPPFARRPMVRDSNAVSHRPDVPRISIDLDTSGRWQEDW